MQLFLNRDHQVNAMSLMMNFLDWCILLQTAYCLLFLNTTNTSYFDSHHMAYIFLEILLKYHYFHVDNSFHLRLSLMVSINWILHHIIWATTLVKKSIWYFDTPLKIWLLRSIPATLCVRWQQHNIWENNFLHELFTSWFQINILRAIRGFAIQGDTKEEKIENLNHFHGLVFELNSNLYIVHTLKVFRFGK